MMQLMTPYVNQTFRFPAVTLLEYVNDMGNYELMLNSILIKMAPALAEARWRFPSTSALRRLCYHDTLDLLSCLRILIRKLE